MSRPQLTTPVPRRGHYQYRTVTIPPSTSLSDARRMLTDEAEYGRWELARTSLFVGGTRKVLLRRRVLRVEPTLGDDLLD